MRYVLALLVLVMPGCGAFESAHVAAVRVYTKAHQEPRTYQGGCKVSFASYSTGEFDRYRSVVNIECTGLSETITAMYDLKDVDTIIVIPERGEVRGDKP